MSFKKLDQAQIKAYQRAVSLHGEILKLFLDLSDCNRPMAWGLLHELDTIMEIKFSQQLRESSKPKQEEIKRS